MGNKMNIEFCKQVTEYLETIDGSPAIAKVLIKLLVSALEEKEKECESLKIDLRSEKHARKLDSTSACDYL
jgi:hypothetical protein